MKSEWKKIDQKLEQLILDQITLLSKSDWSILDSLSLFGDLRASCSLEQKEGDLEGVLGVDLEVLNFGMEDFGDTRLGGVLCIDTKYLRPIW